MVQELSFKDARYVQYASQGAGIQMLRWHEKEKGYWRSDHGE
jgi:hypothetical protein